MRIGSMLVAIAALMVVTAGCANRDSFGNPPTWPREGPVSVEPTLKPAARDHVSTSVGEIELFAWDMRRYAEAGSRARRLARTPPVGVVLLCPGGSQPAQLCGDYAAQLYGDYDIVVVAWNYPGIGSSTGPPSLQRMVRASLEVYDHLHTRFQDRPILVQGIALGAGPALYVASKREVAAVILDSPLRATHIAFEPKHGWWNLWIGSLVLASQVPAECDIARTARLTAGDCPFLVIHGNADDVVPPQHAVEVFNAWPYRNKHLLMIPAAGHFPSTIETAPDDYRRAVRQVLEQITGR